MIALFTDYGLQGPYIGQVLSVLSRIAPEEKVITLFSDLPRQNQKAAAYLLPRCIRSFTEETIFFCVVDPGVGSFRDDPVVLRVDQHWYVGPNNGLFNLLVRHAGSVECWKINWRPEKLSKSFHGRDLYAPICGMIANGLDIPGEKIDWEDNYGWPDNLHQVIYIDAFGNCMVGIGIDNEDVQKDITIHQHVVPHATTFSDVPTGEAFWYENSLGLMEIAVNQGNAQAKLNISVGDVITVQ